MRPEGWDALLEQAMTEEDPVKRLHIVEEMERRAYRDLVCIPLWHRPVLHAYTPKLKSDRKPMFQVAGIPINGWLWKDIWLEK
jgi:ABC-type transport system substrate-binding protein